MPVFSPSAATYIYRTDTPVSMLIKFLRAPLNTNTTTAVESEKRSRPEIRRKEIYEETALTL